MKLENQDSYVLFTTQYLDKTANKREQQATYIEKLEKVLKENFDLQPKQKI